MYLPLLRVHIKEKKKKNRLANDLNDRCLCDVLCFFFSDFLYQSICCGYSFELHRQSMFLSRNKKINVYPCKPQYYYIKEGFKGVKII